MATCCLQEDVAVNTFLQTPTQGSDAFAAMLLLTPEVDYLEAARVYRSSKELREDDIAGVDRGSWVVDAIETLEAQKRHLNRFVVGRLTVDQDTAYVYAPDSAAEGDWTVTLNGVDYTYAADGDDTVSDILTALTELVNAVDGYITASDDGTDLTVESGVPFTATFTAPGASGWTQTSETVGAYADVEADLDAIVDTGYEWYDLRTVIQGGSEWTTVSDWVEANGGGVSRRIATLQSAEADIATSATSDILSDRQTQNITRTAVVFRNHDYGSGAEDVATAVFGNRLGFSPDSWSPTFKHLELVGVTPDNLDYTQIASVKGKSGNVYPCAFHDGKMTSGDWIDARISADWFATRLQERVCALMRNYADLGRRIPYGETGVALFEAEIRKAHAIGVEAGPGEADGHFEPGGLQINRPDLDEVSAQMRESRTYPPFQITILLTGAIHSVEMNVYFTDDPEFTLSIAA